MGLSAVPTTSAFYDNAHVDADRRIGAEGQGLQIAFSALDSGRLGIAAVATGIAQAALDDAMPLRQRANDVRPQDHRPSGPGLPAGRHGRRGGQRQGHLPRRGASPRRRPAVLAQASVAKLVATDAAMKVTTDAVQVFGGAGYTRDYRVERYMREAKITQIFEGTNQIQRLVIARGLTD